MKLNNNVFESSNLYRILGTNSNAGDELIKQRYQEKVREFPPEKNPEEFKIIREAYDTLKDPFKRSEYDLRTKYQGKAERLLQEAVENMEWGEIEEAEELLEEAAQFAADNLYILRFQAEIAAEKNNLRVFDNIFEKLEELFPKKKEFMLYLNKAVILLEENYTKYAARVLKEMEKKFPAKEDEILSLYIFLYDQQGRFNKIWSIFSKKLKNMTEINDKNIRTFLNAVSLINKYEKWNKKDSLIDLTESFREMIKDDEETRDDIIKFLDDNYFEAEEFGDVQAQKYFRELTLLIDEDPERKAEFEELKLIEKIMNEIDRMAEDPKLSPYIFYTGIRLFFNWAYQEQNLQKFIDYPPKYQMQEFEEEYSANLEAIKRMKKKYSRVYEIFKDEWDEISRKCRYQLNNQQLSLFDNQVAAGEDSKYKELASGQIISTENVGRNDPCPCGSGKKYKKCCLNK